MGLGFSCLRCSRLVKCHMDVVDRQKFVDAVQRLDTLINVGTVDIATLAVEIKKVWETLDRDWETTSI